MADLELYCSRVAGAVGLLSVRIFEAPQKGPSRLAHALGGRAAHQRAARPRRNAGLGRLYLPRELLQAWRTRRNAPCGLAPPRIAGACEGLVAVAERRFDEAMALLAAMPRAVASRAHHLVVYRRLLQRLRQRGFTRIAEPVKLSKAEKIWLILRHGLF
jgi:phytoene synthase